MIAGSDAIVRDLGWRRQYPDLRRIIETAWDWHLANPDGYSH